MNFDTFSASFENENLWRNFQCHRPVARLCFSNIPRGVWSGQETIFISCGKLSCEPLGNWSLTRERVVNHEGMASLPP